MDMICLCECGVIVSDQSVAHIKQVVETVNEELNFECYATPNQF